jgi:hypothetical protein
MGSFKTAPEKHGFSGAFIFKRLRAKKNGGTSLRRAGTLNF